MLESDRSVRLEFVTLILCIMTLLPRETNSRKQHNFDRVCHEIAAVYRSEGIVGLFASDQYIYQKKDLFTRYIEPHQVGQWLAENVASKHGGSIGLIHLLNRLYNTTIAASWTSWYVSESLIHAAVWHSVITLVFKEDSATVWTLEKEFCEPFRVLSARCPNEMCAYVQCVHGIGHGGLYVEALRRGLMYVEQYDACRSLPNDALPMQAVILAANSACDGAPSAYVQHSCLHGAYHGASLLGYWGVSTLLAKHARDVNATEFRQETIMLFQRARVRLCATYATHPAICHETSCYSC